jgi:hypothetical protein
VHDRELKGLVAAMKLEAKAKISEVLDIVKSKELWRTAKCLRALCACNESLEFGRQRYSRDW